MFRKVIQKFVVLLTVVVSVPILFVAISNYFKVSPDENIVDALMVAENSTMIEIPTLCGDADFTKGALRGFTEVVSKKRTLPTGEVFVDALLKKDNVFLFIRQELESGITCFMSEMNFDEELPKSPKKNEIEKSLRKPKVEGLV